MGCTLDKETSYHLLIKIRQLLLTIVIFSLTAISIPDIRIKFTNKKNYLAIFNLIKSFYQKAF